MPEMDQPTSQEKWDRRFLDMALGIAQWSKDASTKVGCVIIGPAREIRTTGYNGLPRGVLDGIPERNLRPEKYFWFEHSERNAVYNAARVGIPLQGCTAYIASTPTPLMCCADCARGLIQSGITAVVVESGGGEAEARWSESVAAGMQMFREAGVEVRVLVKRS